MSLDKPIILVYNAALNLMFLSYSKKLLISLLLFLALSPANAYATETSSLTGSFSTLGQTVNFSASSPTAGGTLTGSFTGACTGTINGNFTAGVNTISGSVNGQCNIVGFTQAFILNYTGSIDSVQRKLIINSISHIDGSPSIVTNFISLPSNTDINITTEVATVQTGTTYTDPQNSSVKVNFNSLPATPGSLSFNQTVLTPAEILQYKAINGTAYQLVSSMTNGTFNFDLTLPVANGINLSTLIIRYGTTINALNNIVTQTIVLNGDGTATIQGLDHFTYFLVSVVIPQPSANFTNPINNANKNNVTLTGTGLANGNINYTFTDAGSAHSVSGTGTVAANGTINIAGINLSSLDDGVITVSVTSSDGLGNISDPGTATSTKDTAVPATPTATINNPVNLGNRNNITLAGSGEAGSTYNYTLSDGFNAPLSGTGTVSGSGTFTVTGLDLSGFNDGNISVAVSLTDAAGNVSSASSYTASKDTGIPTVISQSITSSNINSLFTKVGDLISVLFTTSEQIQTPTVTIAGQTVTAFNIVGNNWRADYTLVSVDIEGLIPYTISFQDLASNPGTSVNTTSTIIFDKTVPNTIDNTSTSWFNSSVTITLTCSDNNGCSQTFYTTDGSIPTLASTNGSNVTFTSNGIFTVKYFSVDLAGNAGPVLTALNAVKVDIVAPSGSWINPIAGSALKRTIAISFTSADDFSGLFSTQVFYKKNDGVDTFHPLPSSWDTYPLDLGSYILRLQVIDVAGNITIIDEVVDIIAVITNLKTETLGTDKVIVTWDTNHPTTSKVKWDGGESHEDNNLVAKHVLIITGLRDSTGYNFHALSKILTGPYSISEETVGARTFSVTGPPPATVSPVAAAKPEIPKKVVQTAIFEVPTAFAAENEASVEGETTEAVSSSESTSESAKNTLLLDFTQKFVEAVEKVVFAILSTFGGFLRAIFNR